MNKHNEIINLIKKGVKKMGKIIAVSENKYYYEIDGIRLIFEDNELTGWYNPSLDRVV